MKASKFVVSMVLIFALATGTKAFGSTVLVIDMDDRDLNTIEDQFSTGSFSHKVIEDYNENYLSPWPSHGGYGIVNALGDRFDKDILFGEQGWYEISFDVLNTTPYTWSDYHFFIDIRTGLMAASSDVFTNWSSTESDDVYEVSFWAPNYVAPGERVTFDFSLRVGEEYKDFVTFDQLATTAPIPGAVWLLGSGLIFIFGLRKKIKK